MRTIGSTLIVVASVSGDTVELDVGAGDALRDVLRDRPGAAETKKAWTR